VERDGIGVDLGAYTGGFAEMCEVGGETVADVDGGRGEAVAKKGGTDGEAGLRKEVRMVLRGCGS
jgi:hypothetical protein